MRIYFLHDCPKKSARDLIDADIKSVIKSNCQIMANCYEASRLFNEAPRLKGKAYGQTHGDPCTLWAKASNLHFDWIMINTMTLDQEYRRRFQKMPPDHQFIAWCFKNPPRIPRIGTLDDPPLCIPAQYTVYDGAVECYREFYRKEKRFSRVGKSMFVWTNMETPTWIMELPRTLASQNTSASP